MQCESDIYEKKKTHTQDAIGVTPMLNSLQDDFTNE